MEERKTNDRYKFMVVILAITVVILAVIVLRYALGSHIGGQVLLTKAQKDAQQALMYTHQTTNPPIAIININTADIETLMTLPGIGETLAARIIEYREEHGSFKNPEDIQNVQGIGAKLYGNIKDSISVGR